MHCCWIDLFTQKYRNNLAFSDSPIEVSFPGGTSGIEPTCKYRDIRNASLVLELGRFLSRAEQPTSILAWIPWAEESAGLQSIGLKNLDMTEAT